MSGSSLPHDRTIGDIHDHCRSRVRLPPVGARGGYRTRQCLLAGCLYRSAQVGDHVLAGDGFGGRDLACDNASRVDGNGRAAADATKDRVVLCLQTGPADQLRVGDLPPCVRDVIHGGSVEIAQNMTRLQSVRVWVEAPGLGHDRDTGEVLWSLEQAQGPLWVDPPGYRDCLVWRAVETPGRFGRPCAPTQVCCAP